MAQQPLKLASGLTSPAASITATTAATSTTTGALIVSGGAGIAGDVFIGGSATISQNLTITGNLTVNGTTTTINSTVVNVDDILLELGAVASPSDATANGGGISLLGTTNKTIIWDSANGNWTSNQDWNIPTGKVFKINNAAVLSATSLGTAVVSSSLTTVGTLTGGTWNASLIGLAYGGTNKNMTAVNGGVVWTDVDSMEVSAAGTAGQLLQSNGAAAPTWTNASALSVAIATNAVTAASTTLIDDAAATTGYISWVNATTGSVAQRITSTKLTFNASTGALTSTLFSGNGSAVTNLDAGNIATGTLVVGRGGTGTTTAPTQGGIIFGSSSVAYGTTAAGTAGQLLQSAGTGTPTWTNASALSVSTATTATNLSGGTALTIAGAPTGASYNNNITLGATGTTASGAIAIAGGQTIAVNTQTTVDAWSTSTYKAVDYTIYIFQGTKYRVSKVLALSDGTTADSTEYGIIERGGTMSGIDVQVTMAGTTAQLAVTITDAATTNAVVKAIRTTLG